MNRWGISAGDDNYKKKSNELLEIVKNKKLKNTSLANSNFFNSLISRLDIVEERNNLKINQ